MFLFTAQRRILPGWRLLHSPKSRLLFYSLTTMNTPITLVLTALSWLLMICPMRSWAQCIDGDCDGGKGAYIDIYDNMLVGDFEAGTLTGQGSCHYKWGARYTGNLHQGHPHGKGTYFQSTGLTQRALWQHGYILSLLQDTVITTLTRPIVVLFIPDDTPTAFFERDQHEIQHFFGAERGLLPAQRVITLSGNKATVEQLRQTLTAALQVTDRVFLFAMGHIHGTTLADGQPNTHELADLLPLARQYTDAQHIVFSFIHLKQQQTRMAAPTQPPLARSAQLLPLNTFLLEVEQRPSVEFDGLRTSLYLHFCLLGLRGAADTNIDAAVQAQELYDFIDRKIQQRLLRGLLPAQLTTHLLTGFPYPSVR